MANKIIFYEKSWKAGQKFGKILSGIIVQKRGNTWFCGKRD